MKLYLVRHTAVDVPKGVCYGQTDVPLDASVFVSQAENVRLQLAQIKADTIFCSPLSRCLNLADYLNLTNIEIDHRLMELNFGEWEMQAWNDIDMSPWQTDWHRTPAPGGESFVQMYRRVASFLDEISTRNIRTAIVFTHGGVINCAKIYCGQADWHSAFNTSTPYGSTEIFEIQ